MDTDMILGGICRDCSKDDCSKDPFLVFLLTRGTTKKKKKKLCTNTLPLGSRNPIWVVVKKMVPFLDPYYNTAPNI